MAVTITDRRTTVDQADATTGWTGGGFGLTTSDVAEATGAVAASLATTTGQVYFTGAGVNLGTSPGTLVYVYAFNNALQLAWDNSPPPVALMLGDGTDRIGFDMAGVDRRVFAHSDGPTSWQSLVLDTGQAGAMDTAGNTYLVAGTFAALNFAAITDWGCSFDTQSKALGGGYNVAVDIIRYGNDGIRITAGGVGTEGKFSEIATADRSTVTLTAHGVLRAYTTIAFGCQAPLTFGESGAATNSYFNDTGIVVVYEDRNIGDDKYYLNVEGNAGATNEFVLTSSTITTAGPFVAMTLSTEINLLTLTGVSFTALGGAIAFPTDTNGTTRIHEVTSCSFGGCGAITVGSVVFTDNSISNCGQVTSSGSDMSRLTLSGYEGTANTSALIYNETADPAGELDNSSFTMGTALTHGIEFGLSSPTTIGLVGIIFNGYSASTDVNNSMLHFKRTTGTITLNITGGGTTPSWRTDGAVIDLVLNPVDTTVTTVTTAGAVIPSVNVFLKAATGTGLPIAQVTTIANSGTTATATTTGVHGLATNDQVLIEGASLAANNGVFTVTGITSTTIFTYTMLTTPGSSPTGSITTTFVFLYGNTNGSGVISMTRAIPSTFTVEGWARKGSASPYYKQGPISGSVTAASGGTFRAVMVAD